MKGEVAILLGGWTAAAVLLLATFRVYQRKPLVDAPTRSSRLSLPVAGVIILAYIIVAVALDLGAVGAGLVSMEDLTPPKTRAAVSSQPATADWPATASQAATVSASQPEPVAPAQFVRGEIAKTAIDALAKGLTIIAVLILLPPMFREGFRGWGLHPRQIPRGIMWGVVAFVVVFPLVIGSELGMEALYLLFGHKAAEHETIQALKQSQSLLQKSVFVVGAAVVAPFAEELFFRGILQTSLVQYGWGFIMPQVMPAGRIPATYRPTALHRWLAIVLAAAAFALVHEWDAAPIIFVLALGLGYVYERTGCLWAAIVLHACFNAAQLVLNSLGS